MLKQTSAENRNKHSLWPGFIGLARCWCRHFCSFVFSVVLTFFPSPYFCRSLSHPGWSFVLRVVLSGLRGALVIDCLCYKLLTVTNKKKNFCNINVLQFVLFWMLILWHYYNVHTLILHLICQRSGIFSNGSILCLERFLFFGVLYSLSFFIIVPDQVGDCCMLSLAWGSAHTHWIQTSLFVFFLWWSQHTPNLHVVQLAPAGRCRVYIIWQQKAFSFHW